MRSPLFAGTGTHGGVRCTGSLPRRLLERRPRAAPSWGTWPRAGRLLPGPNAFAGSPCFIAREQGFQTPSWLNADA